jgi:hypothetical protein
VPQGSPDSVTEVTITQRAGSGQVPVLAGEETTFRDTLRNRDAAGNRATYDVGGQGIADFYINQVAGESDVQDLSQAGNKAAVDVDGKTPEDAANEWLIKEGFIGE